MYQWDGVSAKNSIQSAHIYINSKTKEEIWDTQHLSFARALFALN